MNRKHPDAQFKAGNQQFIIFWGSEYFNCICCQIKLFLHATCRTQILSLSLIYSELSSEFVV
jgi:hypothetical protein